ncbi:SEPT9 protein, partial [Polyodon spathula]|nr:SEPT9 protein [Polyodon spathula]
MKNKMVSSLSFNRGSMAIAKTNGNTGTSITRVSSFQTKFNPNGFSSSCGPGSDNDSLHSSTSSLEYQASSKLSSCASPPQSSCASPPQSPMGMSDFKPQRICSPALQKFSSHGNMFHSEVEPPLALPAEPMRVNHGSMPSLDLRITESRGAGNARSPSLGYRSSGPTWNAASLRQNSGPLRREPSFTSGTQSPKPKDPTKLNKFPLDLDNLVAKPQEAPKEAFPKPAPRSHLKLSSPTSSASPAVSTSSLDTVAAGIHSKTAKAGSMPPPGRFPVPSVSESPVPLSPPQTPQFRLVSQPQVVQLSPVAQPSTAQGKVTQKTQISEEPAQGPPPQKDSVGSILQRIASFSRADSTGGPKPRENKYHGNKQEREEPPGQREADQRMKKLEGTKQRDNDLVIGMRGYLSLFAEKSMAEPQSKPDPDPEPKTEATVTGQDLFGYVGIESVLDQMRRKAVKTGFEFNIMVVGKKRESGLGKSTLVNTLFKSKVSRKSCNPSVEEGISKTVNLQSISHVIEEKGVKMKLTVIDTPGFGDQINNLNCWEPIMKYINEQYEKYLKEEININRKRKIPDTRVHCCVYFVPPTGHCLRPLDLEFMKRLGKVVSVVPVIAKSDTLTLDERQRFKERIRQDLWTNGIKVYPQKEYDEDAEDRILNDKIREKIPFAVVGTDKEHQVNGKNVLGRKTNWGVIEVENVAHCEFANLRDLLIRSHLQDLKDVTHNIHYETYRVQRLNESNLNGLGLSTLPLASVNGTVVRKESESNL